MALHRQTANGKWQMGDEVAHQSSFSNTTYETLAIERPEPETKLSKRAPELKNSSTRKLPRNSHRLAASLIKTGSLPGWMVRSLLTAPVLGPWPQRTTCGAAGLNFWLRQAATILPPCVGRHDTLLPPTSAWISSRVYWLPTINMSACLRCRKWGARGFFLQPQRSS